MDYYSHNDYYRVAHHASVSPALIGLVFLFMLFIFLVIYVLYAFLLSRIFKKAGIHPGIAWVPFYNTWKLLEMGDQKGFWSVLAIIPFVNYASAVFMYIAMYKVGLKFGKDGTWVLLAIFLPVVWLAILAFDGSKWRPKTVKA